MLGTARPKQIADHRPSQSERPACRALVPVAEPAQWSHRPRQPSPPAPTFVAQLIANAEQRTQTDRFVRENAADALSAYRARQRRFSGTGFLTRQMI